MNKMHTGSLSEQQRKRLLGRPVGGRILKRIFNKQDGKEWRGFNLHRKGKVAGYCKQDNEPAGSIKCGKLLD